MFDVDVGVTLPFALERDGQPLDLSAATGVALLLDDGTSVPLAVTDAPQGLAEYVVEAGALRAGFKRGNVRVTFDGGRAYHSDTFQLRVAALFA